MTNDIRKMMEAVEGFLDHLDARPNALIHNNGKTLSREHLRALLAFIREQHDDVRDMIVAAYEAGATDVHNNFQPGIDYPEFGEAAMDYASSVMPARSLVAELEGEDRG